MGLSPERHDIMSQETHAGCWIGFRQPVLRVLAERDGEEVEFTWEANPGEVWEEEEFFIELSWRMDRDGALGVRKNFESPYRAGEKITIHEHYRWIFENSVPGLPEAANSEENLTPLEYMRRYGAFEVRSATSTGNTRRNGFATPERQGRDPLGRRSPDWGWPEHALPGTIESHVAKARLEKGEMVPRADLPACRP